MKNILPRLTLAGLLIAAAALAPTAARAQDAKTNSAPKSHAREKSAHHPRATPFHGKITALDKNAMTLSLGKRVFHVTSETKITKDGKPATFADGVVGESVGGNYRKGADGKLTAQTISFGVQPAKGKKSAKKAKAEAAEKE